MRIFAEGRWVVAAAVVASIMGCAHRDPDPFIYGSEEFGRERATPPECFTAPLTDCIGDPGERNALDCLASPWREDFEPDLAARICRGDGFARQRWLEGARRLGLDDPREPVYLELLGHCSATAEPSPSSARTIGGDGESRPRSRGMRAS